MTLPVKTSGSEAEVDQQLADLLAEVAQRLQAGETVDFSELLRRHPEQADRLQQFLPAMKTLAELGHSQSSAPSCLPGSTEAAGQVQGTLGDFRILQEIGRGGMGVVYEAEQISLGRRVALKVLPFAAVLDPRHLQRFKNEAQAAAALEHPNIVNIYAVGCERGVHYYAMQFIEGQTLAQVIEELRKTSGASSTEPSLAATTPLTPAPSPLAADSSSLAPEPRTLNPEPSPLTPDPCSLTPAVQAAISTQRSHRTPDFFRSAAQLGIQAAEALEHAHQMGVVHRDIKPSNLMIDARAHLWITDFGLAMTQKDPALTMTGDIVGTLRYMSPEQALGKRHELNYRTDIYSLGVTLYELLTLQPAFAGENRETLVRRLLEDDPPRPRTVNRAIPKDLETIVLKAMTKEPQSRYATAQQLADDLRRFLEDKPILARRPSLATWAAKWARRHKAVIWAAALLLVIAAAASAAATALVWHQKEQTEIALHDAEVEAARANAVIGLVQQMLSSASPYGLEGKDYTVRQLLDEFSVGIGDRLKGQPEVEATVRALIGKTYAQLLVRKEADVHLRAAIELYRKTLGNEHEKLADCLIDHAFNLTTPEGTNAAREALSIYRRLDDPSGIMRALWVLHNRLIWFEKRYDEADRAFEEAAALAREHPADVPREFATMVANQGAQKRDRGELREAEALAREAVALHRRVDGEDHPELAWGLRHLGTTLVAKGDSMGAESCFREALAIFHKRYGRHYTVDGVRAELEKILTARGDRDALERLRTQYGDKPNGAPDEIARLDRAVKLEPNNAHAFLSRAQAWRARNDFPKALADANEAIRLAPKDVGAYLERARVFGAMGDLDRALADDEEAIRLDPTSPVAYHCRAWAYHDRGRGYGQNQEDLDRALRDFDEAIRLDPKFGRAYAGRGFAHVRKGSLDKALADFNEAIRLDPGAADVRVWRSGAYRSKGELEKALADANEAIRLAPKNVGAYLERARVFGAKGDLDRGLADCEEAVRLDPTSTDAYHCRAWAYRFKGQLDKALADLDQRVRLEPKSALAYSDRGQMLVAKGDRDKALADFNEAIRLDPGAADARLWRSGIHRSNGELEKALADANEAIRLAPKNVGAYLERARVFEAKGDLDRALADCDEAVRLNPTSPDAYHRRAWAYRGKGSFDKALADLDQRVRLEPKSAWAYIDRGQMLVAKGDRDKALADFNEAIRIDPKFPPAYHNRGLAYGRQKQEDLDRALRDFDEAIRLDPKSAAVYADRGSTYQAKGDWGKALADFSKAVELQPKQAVYWRRLVAAQYRAGQWKAAVETLDKAMELRSGGDAFDWFFLAMAHWQLGHKDEARKWYDKAIQWMEQNKPADEELRRFRAEAAELLGIPLKPPAAKEKTEGKG
jgi:tetratricopeptide (TPR) repeat protein